MTYGIGHTLPSVVYAIREDDDNFKLATTRSNALAGTSVSFGSSGSGNAHKLIMSKSNEKTLITVDICFKWNRNFSSRRYFKN